jgi:plasmid stabilization system protein ParE
VKLRYQKRALRQIDSALSYIYAHSPQGAAHIEARLRAITSLLLVQSFVGRKTSISRVRRVYLTPYPYFIDYYLGEDEIVIQRFRHTSRKPLRE